MGKRVCLENERLLIEVDEMGAELSRIYDKSREREVLWGGDLRIWNRKAPLLFPFIGNCFQKEYRYNGVTRPMTQHGFARDFPFQTEKETEDEVWFFQEDSEETRELYPFHYRLEVGHRLEENRLTVSWRVVNRGHVPMYFMIGGHPGFRVPEGMNLYDFSLKFVAEKGQEDILSYQYPDKNGYIPIANRAVLSLKDGKVPITPGFFDDKVLTYIFPGAQVREVSLFVKDIPYVTVKCPGFPYLGIWTVEKTHPFVCLEPWYGRADTYGFAGELKDRTGILALQPDEEFKASYLIEIH